MLVRKIFAAAIAVLMFGSAFAEEEKKMSWDDFAPPPDKKFDWVQMNSGEWLKGEIKVMYSFMLEFDSDELDLLELDMEDVKQIRSAGNQRILVETGRRDTEVMQGKLVVDGEKVQLTKKDGTVVDIKRVDLVSIAGGSTSEWDNWSGNISFGLTLRGGNTETADLNNSINIRRRTAMTRLNVDYLATYSEAAAIDSTTGEKTTAETANNQRLNGYFDWFLTSRLYWQILNAEWYRDPFVNIANQYSLSTAVGYDFIRTSRTEWTFNVGAGYQETQFDSVQAGEDDKSDSPFGTIGTRLDHEISGDLDFLFDYSARFLNQNSGTYTHHLVTTLSYELIADLDIDLSFIWDRIEDPTPIETDPGPPPVLSTPEQDDYQIIVSIAYDF